MFKYVDIKIKDCEGWLNLFFDDNILCLVRDKELAKKIRESIDATQPSIEADAGHDPFCPKCGGITVTKCMNCEDVW